MKIVAHTSTDLVIRDAAPTLRAFGMFLVAVGAFAIWIGATHDPEAPVSVVPIVIGALVGLAGTALLVLPPRSTYAFNKSDRVFVIAKEWLGRVRSHQTIRLRDIADASLEESVSDEGSTYRMSVTLADQRRIPWTSYYSSDYARLRRVLELVRGFLGLEPSPAVAATMVKLERDARRGRVAFYAMGGVCLLFLAIGTRSLVKEQRRLTVFQPVTATVLSTRVDEHGDSDGSSYEPVVVYRYVVGDRQFTASQVTPLRESRGSSWAFGIVRRYQVGASYTAFYDPSQPGDAFLIRKRSLLPWGFIGMSLIGLLFAVAGFRGSYDALRQR